MEFPLLFDISWTKFHEILCDLSSKIHELMTNFEYDSSSSPIE